MTLLNVEEEDTSCVDVIRSENKQIRQQIFVLHEEIQHL